MAANDIADLLFLDTFMHDNSEVNVNSHTSIFILISHSIFGSSLTYIVARLKLKFIKSHLIHFHVM